MTRSALIPASIVLITLLAFAGVCRHEFTSWDDNYNISNNPDLNPPTAASIGWYWRHQSRGLYIPLTYSVWGLLAHFSYLSQPDEFGVHLNPYVFHTANVVLHVISAVLVYAILRSLVANKPTAGAGAMLFAIHPLQVEPVAWAAGLKDVLCGCLSFAAIWLYLRTVREPGRRRWMWYALATIALIAAMLAKPAAMVVPAIALVLHVWGLRRRWSEGLAMLAAWFLLAVACAMYSAQSQPAIGITNVEQWKRPFLAGDALTFYLYKLVFPARLGTDYGWQPTVISQEWWFWVLWICPALLIGWLWSQRRSWPMLWASLAVFVIGVAPVLGLRTFLFQHFSTVADHYVYIAMLGPALAASAILARYSNRISVIIASVILTILLVRTILQTRHWRDDITLNTHTLAVNARSFAAAHNLGYALRIRGQIGDAVQWYSRAVELYPDYWAAHENLGEVLFLTGYTDDAIAHIKRAIEIKRRLPPALGIDYVADHVKLGNALMDLRRYEEAAAEYRAALRARPSDQVILGKLQAAAEATSP